MSKPYLKTWGYSEKPCGVCGANNKENEFVQMSDRSLTGVMCPKHLMSLKLRLNDANREADGGKDAGERKSSVPASQSRAS